MDGIHPLSQQVKMDEIAKNMIPNANSAERNPKAQCDIHKRVALEAAQCKTLRFMNGASFNLHK